MIDDYLMLLRCLQSLFKIGHVILTVQRAYHLSNVLLVRFFESNRGVVNILLLSSGIEAIVTLFLAALDVWNVLVRVTALLATSLSHL